MGLVLMGTWWLAWMVNQRLLLFCCTTSLLKHHQKIGHYKSRKIRNEPNHKVQEKN